MPAGILSFIRYMRLRKTLCTFFSMLVIIINEVQRRLLLNLVLPQTAAKAEAAAGATRDLPLHARKPPQVPASPGPGRACGAAPGADGQLGGGRGHAAVTSSSRCAACHKRRSSRLT